MGHKCPDCLKVTLCNILLLSFYVLSPFCNVDNLDIVFAFNVRIIQENYILSSKA